jgi:hypothetical protein
LKLSNPGILKFLNPEISFFEFYPGYSSSDVLDFILVWAQRPYSEEISQWPF